MATPQSEERGCKRTSRRARKDGAPPEPSTLAPSVVAPPSDLTSLSPLPRFHISAVLEGPTFRRPAEPGPLADLARELPPILRTSSSSLAHTCESHPVPVRGPSLRNSVTLQHSHKSRVNCQLGSTKQWESINHNLQPTAARCVGDPHSPYSARTCWSSRVLPLLCKFLLSQQPRPRTCCTVVAKCVVVRPHPQMRLNRGSAKERRRWRSTRNKGESMRVNGYEGHVDNDIHAFGPVCDLTMALSRGSILGTEWLP